VLQTSKGLTIGPKPNNIDLVGSGFILVFLIIKNFQAYFS